MRLRRKINDFHWILQAGLSVLVADCAIAAIFAGETGSLFQESRAFSLCLAEVESQFMPYFVTA